MAMKRSAHEAFGKPQGQLSAFAAARQARLNVSSIIDLNGSENTNISAADLAGPAQYVRQDTNSILEDIDTEDDNLLLPLPVKAPPVKLSTFIQSQSNVRHDDETTLELVLRANQTVTVLGEYDLRVLAGAATIYGTLLHPEVDQQRVYAPSNHGLPPIMGRKDNTIVRLTSVNPGIQQLEILSSTFRNIWAVDEAKSRSFVTLLSSADDAMQRSLNLLEVDDDSKKALTRLNSKYEDGDVRPIIMPIGSKSAGKSTFTRLLCNMIHCRWPAESCLYLDLDPGQPEFGPPGQISLIEVKAPILGPSFTHPAGFASQAYRLVRSHAIAASSFKDDPDHYLACAFDLFHYATTNKFLQTLPIVVNSCGWVSGLGATVALQLARGIQVTDIVQLGALGDGLTESLASIGCAIHPIPRRPTRSSARSPAELRAMQTMSYFHHRPRSSSSPLHNWIHQPLSALRPWEVSYSASSPSLHAILSYTHSPSPHFLAEVLNGAVVAIVVVAPDLLDPATISHTKVEALPYMPPDSQGLLNPLDPRRSECLGLALVRGIDVPARKLLLVTPVSGRRVAAAVRERGSRLVLVRGGFDAPDWAYLEDLRGGALATDGIGEARPWVTRKERVGVEGAVWRLRHPPMAGTALR